MENLWCRRPVGAEIYSLLKTDFSANLQVVFKPYDSQRSFGPGNIVGRHVLGAVGWNVCILINQSCQ